MKFRAIFMAVLLGGMALTSAMAQQKQPKPKSKGEYEALMAVFAQGIDPDQRIAAVENLLTKYADTEFKSTVLQVAAQSAQEKNDYEKMTIYAERTLEADPKAYPAMLMLAQGIAQHTKEFDLDREEKLAKAEKYAKDAIPLVAAAEKPNPNITDAQWAGVKKNYTAQAHEALAAAAVARKKWDVAIAEYKQAVEVSADVDPATLVRLAMVYNNAGKPDDALASLEKLNTLQNVHPAVRSAAANEKIRANKMKAASGTPAPPATPAPAPAPPKQQ